MEQKLRATLITGRTIEQGVGKELGKGSEEYYVGCAVCFFDKSDMVKLGIKNGSIVRVTSKYGSVIVKAQKYRWGVMPGMVFMPCGSWANVICGDETYTMGMPLYRGFPVEVEAAPDQAVLTLEELLMQQFGRNSDE
ncbi:molybdopterin dinucleotide binding domain-containing protein [Candidatus Bathycorpusculum sp.]|jgi:formylmethanofuran dehydrogenase subunit D|uniref:molybdopterin dinucleotide binding domain-containing protein n=1 Tax=Candidatus Bathycorpusculum sp. TaxID=2994959 RepID=UPI0028212E3D|nr:molybdopterin dinucleotide-binding protein [Candidatus Termitimicrobium sp.]